MSRGRARKTPYNKKHSAKQMKAGTLRTIRATNLKCQKHKERIPQRRNTTENKYNE